MTNLFAAIEIICHVLLNVLVPALLNVMHLVKSVYDIHALYQIGRFENNYERFLKYCLLCLTPSSPCIPLRSGHFYSLLSRSMCFQKITACMEMYTCASLNYPLIRIGTILYIYTANRQFDPIPCFIHPLHITTCAVTCIKTVSTI